MSADIISFLEARGRRVWQGIEADDPPSARFDYPDLLAMAETMLAARERRFPALIRAGELSAEAAAAELATFNDLVADWQWIVSGIGRRAPLHTLQARRDALDRSLATIADIAREGGGFSPDLAAQAERVIAMRWHLEPGRRTHHLAAIGHDHRAALRSADPQQEIVNA